MLTKTDLGNISSLVKTEIESANKEQTAAINKKFSHLESKINRVERKLDYSINFLDRDHLKLLDRVERIEKHLKLIPLS